MQGNCVYRATVTSHPIRSNYAVLKPKCSWQNVMIYPQIKWCESTTQLIAPAHQMKT